MAEMTDFVELRCVGGGHSKFYQIWLEQKGSSGYYFVNFKYGAIGTSGLTGSKTPNAMMFNHAKGIYQKIFQEKVGKGYQVYKQGSKALPKSMQDVVEKKAKKKTMADYLDIGMMMPTKDDLDNIEAYLKNDDWMAQRKLNGQFLRIMMLDYNTVIGFNKTGGIVEVPDDIATLIEAAEKNVVLDGEIIAGKFYPVDVTVLGGTGVNEHAGQRYATLKAYVDSLNAELIQAVECATSEEGKRALLKKLQDTSEEGMVFKLKEAKYSAGKATSAAKAVSVKIKFWKEISAMLLKWNDKNSIQVALREKVGGSYKHVNVGSVTVPEKYKQELKDAGEECIVRVRYLFATAANKLYQPTLDPDDDGNVVRTDQSKPDVVSELVHEGDAVGYEPIRQITL